MSEFEALNLMYLGFTFNALYTLGFILFTWLGFRMARNIYEDTSATILGKVFTSIYCLFVAFFFIQSNMIGGGILQSYTAILVKWVLPLVKDCHHTLIHPLYLVVLFRQFFICSYWYFSLL